jgi:hypothetical protein
MLVDWNVEKTVLEIFLWLMILLLKWLLCWNWVGIVFWL